MKLFIFLILIILIIFSLFNDLITIGELWSNYHVNSLIGFQKIIDNLSMINNLELDIWNYIFIPFFKLEFLFVISILSIFIYFLINKYK